MTNLITAPTPEELARFFGETKRGAKEGPLSTLTPVFIDVETYMDTAAGISLSSMTLRQYIKSSYLTAIAVGIGEEDPVVFLTEDGKLKPGDEGIVELLTVLAQDPSYIFVAHNAAFDIRVLRFMLSIPQPKNVWCTMEGAMAAWPEFVGGYGLLNLGANLNFPLDKRKIEDFDLDAGMHTELDLTNYNKRDVVCLQELYYREAARVPAIEQEVAIMTHNVRQFHFLIDSDRLDNLMIELDKQAKLAEKSVETMQFSTDIVEAAGEDLIAADGSVMLSDSDIREIFNRSDKNSPGVLRSVRTQRLSNVIQARFGIRPPTTSIKKLSPVWQAAHPEATEILRQTSRANKMLSHTRRSRVLTNVPEVDVELGYCRAHTGRFSSPSQGKGLNLHNVPKHDVAIARPVRQIFCLPPDKMFVRGDLANVEYRVEGWLTDCEAVFSMFDEKRGGNKFADPYCLGWKAYTGVTIDKKSPIRQVSKSATLGLGYIMSAFGYAKVLMVVCGDVKSGVTQETLAETCAAMKWTEEGISDQINFVVEKSGGCSRTIAIAAWHIHSLFNHTHHEFGRTAEWLVNCVRDVSWAGSDYDRARMALDRQRLASGAPDPNKIFLEIDSEERGRASVRVHCGPWPATVCWREPAMRTNQLDRNAKPRLSILKAVGIDKVFSRQLAIENVTQAAARNALCHGLVQLKREFGTQDVLHIHDEVLIICDRNRQAALNARDQLVKVFGPNNSHPMDWAVLIKPDEISVTESLWEDEVDLQPPTEKNKYKGYDRWKKIEADTEDCLLNLT